jgi:3D-(3,5/4)-trihydroxycyclohexane-1,2-dione acylhydrolase (decyclizing)
VVHIQTDRYEGVPSYEGWWEVPVAEVSDDPAVQRARSEYEQARAAQRRYIDTP